MDATFRQERSLHGLRLDVLKSALQKYIRRSDYGKAIFCAMELDLFAEISGGERIRTNFIHRLMIIFLEDIGLGGISLWSDIDQRIDILLNERKKADRSREKEIQAIHELIFMFTNCPKLRIASFVKNYWSCDTNDKNYKETSAHVDPEIEGKFKVMSSMENPTLKELQQKLSDHEKFSLIRKWYRELKTLGENFLCWTVPLCADIFGHDKINIPSSFPNHKTWNYMRNCEAPQFDSFVFDKHTRSQSGNKTLAFFAEQGSYVEPESDLVKREDIAWMKWLYLTKRGLSLPKPQISEIKEKNGKDEKEEKDEKSDWNLIESETQIGNFIMRIQLTTSRNKCDVYLVERNGMPYIVKGPYSDSKTVDRFLELQKLKAEYGIACTEARKISCLPDRWPEGVPLGLRNSVDRSRKYGFLISNSLIPLNKFVSRMHGSNIWPKTLVMDPAKTTLHAGMDQLDEKELLDYYCCVGFRLKFGLSDMAKRNFLYANGRVYSIDEESVKSDINLQNELRGDRWKILSEKWSEYKKKIPNSLVSLLSLQFEK